MISLKHLTVKLRYVTVNLIVYIVYVLLKLIMYLGQSLLYHQSQDSTIIQHAP